MEPIIRVEHLTHTYSAGTPFQRSAVEDVSIDVMPGEFLGIIGHTGSGKSTLIQHLNGLLRPTQGRVLLDGKDIWAEPKKIRQVRFQVGLVFQYPEYQLFEETVYKDIAFGPGNMGLSKEEIDRRVRESAALVGLTEDQLDKSPFDLSGGQKRRVAIAGVIAMEPKVLILDEPTAGLDPKERIRFRNLISELAENRLVLLSTHIVSDVEYIADQILLMKDGSLVHHGTSQQLLAAAPTQVWTCTVPRAQADQLLHQYPVVNLKTLPQGVQLRVLSQTPPTPEAHPAEMTLEDLFLHYFGETAGETDAAL